MARAGTVTKLSRGRYAWSGYVEDDCTAERATRQVTGLPSTPEAEAAAQGAEHELDSLEVRARQAVAAAFADFEAMNNPRDARAWA
jgi:hypothetical protein